MRHSGPLPECGRSCAHGSNRSTALNNVDQDDRECDCQENMNETTECVGRYDSQQPENQQNHKDCPEHLYSFRRSMPLPSLMQFGGLLSVATSPSLIRCPRLLICEADLRSCRGLIQRLPLVPAACDFQLHELLCAGFEYLSSRRRVHSSAMIHAEPNKEGACCRQVAFPLWAQRENHYNKWNRYITRSSPDGGREVFNRGKGQSNCWR